MSRVGTKLQATDNVLGWTRLAANFVAENFFVHNWPVLN